MKNIRLLLLLSIVLCIFVIYSGAASAGCCRLDTGCSENSNNAPYNSQTCAAVGGHYSDLSCTQNTDCQTGCCCIGTTSSTGARGTLKFQCTIPGVFTQSSGDCRSVCDPSLASFNVSGRVINTTGGSVAGAVVTNNFNNLETITTDNSGSFIFHRLYGPTIFSASKPGCVINTTTASVFSNISNLNIVLNCSLQCAYTQTSCGAWTCNDATGIATRLCNCTNFQSNVTEQKSCSELPPAGTCGNNARDSGELCDFTGGVFHTAAYSPFCIANNAIGCNPATCSCIFPTPANSCGNGVQDAGEYCDFNATTGTHFS